MNKLLLTMILSSPFSFAGTLNFSGSITAPPCEVELTSKKHTSYKNTTACVSVIKITERDIYKKNMKDIKGKVLTVSYF